MPHVAIRSRSRAATFAKTGAAIAGAVTTLCVLSSCATSSTGSPSHNVCGLLIGQDNMFAGGPFYIDISGQSSATVKYYAYAVGVPDDGTAVRVSSGCKVGAAVSVSPSGSATVTTLAKAKNGQPAAVLVALNPDAPNTKVTVVRSNGTHRMLELLKPPTPPRASPASGTPST